MPKILFRADAERSIGTGDLMSAIYLAKEFRRNSWRTHFLVRDYAPALKIIEKRGLKNVSLIPHGLSVDDEIGLIRKRCRDGKIDCLFLEITKESLREYASLGRPATVTACANFDGVITGDFDIVANWCIGGPGALYAPYRESGIEFITGFENAILPDYLDRKRIKERRFREGVGNILVTMGGADEFDMTGRVVAALEGYTKGCAIRVITGPGYEHNDRLSRSIKAWPGEIAVEKAPENIFEDMLWADLAISAGGLTSSELVAAKTPAILIATYEHQLERCRYYSDKGWACYAGFRGEIDADAIRKTLAYAIDDIDRLRERLLNSNFRGGNEKIFKSIDTCRQRKKLVLQVSR